MSWGEDEFDREEQRFVYECSICGETFQREEKEKKPICYRCYLKTPQGKRETARTKRKEEYNNLEREFEGEIRRKKEREKRKKRYEKLKREFDRGNK